jgi:hypothetical protein
LGGAALLIAIVGCNLLSSLWYGVSSLGKQQHGIVNAVGLSEDTSFNDLEDLRHVVGKSDSVMLDVPDGIDQMWAAYGLRDLRVSLMQPLLYFEPWTRGGANDFTHDYSDRYVLTGSRSHSDIIDRHVGDAPIWQSSRFELYRFSDYVALGSNWHGVELGPYPWRWLNNDGEILLIRPSEKRYQVSFQCSPGPGVNSAVRHVEIMVNGAGVYGSVTNGTSFVTSPLFSADKVVNRITIHIAEKPTLIPTDSRLLNVGIAKVQLTGEHAVQKLIDDGNPPEITLESLTKNLESMTGIYSDTWVGPEAELSLGVHGDPRQLEIEGEIPVWAPLHLPLRIGVSVNGTRLGEVVVRVKSKFKEVLQVPAALRSQSPLRVSLMSNQFFTGQQLPHNGDTRKLSFFFRSIRLESANPAARL